jgi:hypothetical protein
MFSWRSMRLVAISGAIVTLSLPGAAMAAESVRAYVLVEAKPGQIDAALQSLKSLGNCLAMEYSFTKDEIIAHLECDSLKYLSVAIADDVSKSEAVARVTILAIVKHQ